MGNLGPSAGNPVRSLQQVIVVDHDEKAQYLRRHKIYTKKLSLSLYFMGDKEFSGDKEVSISTGAFKSLLDATEDDLCPKKGVVVKSAKLISYNNPTPMKFEVDFHFKAYRFTGKRPPSQYGVETVKTARRSPTQRKNQNKEDHPPLAEGESFGSWMTNMTQSFVSSEIEGNSTIGAEKDPEDTSDDEDDLDNQNDKLTPISLPEVVFNIKFKANSSEDFETMNQSESCVYEHPMANEIPYYTHLGNKCLDPSAFLGTRIYNSSDMSNGDQKDKPGETDVSSNGGVKQTVGNKEYEIHSTKSLMHKMVIHNYGRKLASDPESLSYFNAIPRPELPPSSTEFIGSTSMGEQIYRGTGSKFLTTTTTTTPVQNQTNFSIEKSETFSGNSMLARIDSTYCNKVRSAVQSKINSIGYVDVTPSKIEPMVTICPGHGAAKTQNTGDIDIISFCLEIDYLLVPFEKT